jgi:hypothetical protein
MSSILPVIRRNAKTRIFGETHHGTGHLYPIPVWKLLELKFQTGIGKACRLPCPRTPPRCSLSVLYFFVSKISFKTHMRLVLADVHQPPNPNLKTMTRLAQCSSKPALDTSILALQMENV